MPNDDARALYSAAKEMEERMQKEKCSLELEVKRAAASGAVVQSQEETKEDPVAKLKHLKEMLDAGLIGQDEYDKMKAVIRPRM